MKKLSSYISAGIAATATFQSSEAATLVTLYGPGAQTPTTSPATPDGISMGVFKTNYRVLNNTTPYKAFFGSSGSTSHFTAGSDLKITSRNSTVIYSNSKGTFFNGAQSGSENYTNISFNGDDGVYEAVGQFNLTGLGNGYLVALAINDDGSALSISAGKTAIDTVPEPSAIALLSLGAGAVMLRRRRKVA